MDYKLHKSFRNYRFQLKQYPTYIGYFLIGAKDDGRSSMYGTVFLDTLKVNKRDLIRQGKKIVKMLKK